MRPPLLAALAVLAVAAPGIARDSREVPAAVPTGPAQTCVAITDIRESVVRSDQVIDFRRRGGRDSFYRVTLDQPCPGLGFEQRFTYSTSIPRLCAQDIITVLQQAPLMRGASCGLAPFQPVRIARVKR